MPPRQPPRKTVHYQKRDAGAFDYEIYFLDDFHVGLRGPRVPVHLFPSYVAAIGSAGVFGRFVHQPFCQQLTLRQVPTVNLGLSGARPLHFRLEHGVSRLIAGAGTVIAEFMSARGYPTRFFEPANPWGNTGTYIAPDGTRTADLFVDRAWAMAMAAYPHDVLDEEVMLSRRRYVADYRRIIDAAPAKLVFLWISQREPDYTARHDSIVSFSGWFPHFVNRPVRDRILAYARDAKGADNVKLVEVISTEGLPAPLYERATGAPATFLSKDGTPSVNVYYPSQAMHDEAATKILAAINAWSA